MINATNNWWGAATGPSGVGPGDGDSVSANVDFSGFLSAAILGCPTLPPADLAIHKIVTPTTVLPGQMITYTIAFSNQGGMPARNVVITEVLPAPTFTVQSLTNSGPTITPTAGVSYTWQTANLLPGQRGVITLTGVVTTMSEGLLSFDNRVMIGSTTIDHDPGNNNSIASVAILNAAPPVPDKLYLPLILNNQTIAPTLPDLVVESITADNSGVTVVIKNIGDGPATGGFWVDGYINPNSPPTGVNQRWYDLGSQGLVWSVTAPLAVNETLILTINGPYYSPTHSNFSGSLTPNTPIWVQVDSWNLATTYGAISEGNESNNINHTLSLRR